MAKTSRKTKKGNTINLNMSGVEAGKNKVVPEGNYPISINTASVEQSQSGNDYIKFEMEISEGKHKGYKLFHNCSLQPQALFNLKSLLVALGFDIPEKAFDLDLKDLIGGELIAEVSHELYEGKKKTRITDFINPEDEDVDSDDDDEDSDDEEETEFDPEDLTDEQLKELAAELGMKKAALKKAKRKQLIEFLEDCDEEDVAEAVAELFPEEDEEDSEEDDEEEDEDEDETDYEDLSVKELKAMCKERGIKVKKGMDKSDIIELLEEDDEE